MSKAHNPCPDCGSSDALLINDDGTTKCFSCGKFTPNSKKQETYVPVNFVKGRAEDIPERGLTRETCSRYKYNVSIYNGRPCHVATYRDLDGNPVFQKIRYTDTKDFAIVGNFRPLLYGAHLFKGQTKKIIITEGEIDCLSISQVIKGYPVVSVPNGAQNAAKAIKQNLEYLEKFEEIVLCFDMDEAGKEAIKVCAPLFEVGKCKVMNLPLKDPNEMLKAKRGDELYKATWNAEEWRPDGIVTPEYLWNEVNKPIEWGLSYPWKTLTKLTYGLRRGEMVVFGAGTGMGKTEFFKSIEEHLITYHKKRVGIIHLEENAKDTALGLMSKYRGIKFHLPDSEYTEKAFKEAFDNTIGTGLAVIYNGYGTTDFDVIKGVIRYMAKGRECEYIFLDHVTAMSDGVESAAEVNQKTRNVISTLANLTRELNIGLITISHLKKSDDKKSHEEGGRVHLDDLYGAAALKQWVSFAFGLERNQQAADREERHITSLRVLKDRYTGHATGEIVKIKYNEDTGLLQEAAESEIFQDDKEEEEEELF